MRVSSHKIQTWFAVMLACIVMLVAPACAEEPPPQKIALIITNADYIDDWVGDLPGVPHDRERIESALNKIGFDVTALADGTQPEMQTALQEFTQRLAEAPDGSTGFLYYTGQGFATSPGRHYFAPADFNMEAMRTIGVVAQSISVEDSLAPMVFDGPRNLVLVFDTNRSALPEGVQDSSTSTLWNRTGRQPEIYQLWATRIGDYAYETPDGSYFTMALAEALLKPGQTATEVFAEVQSAVIEKSQGEQFPEALISSSSPLILNEVDAEDELPIISSPTKSVPLVTSSASGAPRAESLSPELALELAVWQSAVSLNSVEAISDFIDKFPGSVLVDQARLRLKALNARPQSAAVELNTFETFAPARTFEGPARVALLIGNKHYAPNLTDLTNPHNDVLLLKDKLVNAGFEVMLYRDADPDTMGLALSQFAVRLSAEPKDTPPVAFFYYSGHGFAPDPNGPNYLAPVGMKLTSETDLIRALSIEKVIEYVQAFEPSFAFYVLDACRNDPGLPTDDGSKSVGGAKGLSRVDWVGGALVAYATAPGETAFDAPDQTIGPYAKALAEAISQPGLNATDVFKTAQRAVYFGSKKSQTPWISDGLMQDFYFVPETE